MSSSGCTCIIPFYNEKAKSVSYVVDSILRVKNISKIICVDDGSSTTSARDLLKTKDKKVEVIVHNKNKGKSEAIKTAIKRVNSPYIILIDADLKNINPQEIENAVGFILTHPETDMVILRRLHELLYIKLLRWDILISGERVLRTDDLEKIMAENPHGYQLEYAINSYMMRNKKKVYWMYSSGTNVYKIYKYGFFKGILRDLNIHLDIIAYAGLILPIKSFLFFCRQEAKI